MSSRRTYARALTELRDDARGAVYVEFVLMSAVGILVAAVIAAAGAALVSRFEAVNSTLYSGTP